jgi:hypothetical protein
MSITIEDACDVLRGRVRRLAGRDGARRLFRVAKAMHLSAPTLLAFLNDNEDSNITTKTLGLIQQWCDQEEQRSTHTAP